jgi:hypothetical protein
MVDPKDIRPGNMVLRVTGKDVTGKSFLEYTPVAIDEYFYTWAKYCFPIKLTSAILSKCGFIFCKDEWYKKPGNMNWKEATPFLRWKPLEGWFLKDFRLLYQPVYLHKLQNLYYILTGEELTIDPMLFENIDIIGPINFAGKVISKVPASPLL